MKITPNKCVIRAASKRPNAKRKSKWHPNGFALELIKKNRVHPQGIKKHEKQ
jgi:hypothetical protein